jgi:hypothetical protein
MAENSTGSIMGFVARTYNPTALVFHQCVHQEACSLAILNTFFFYFTSLTHDFETISFIVFDPESPSRE